MNDDLPDYIRISVLAVGGPDTPEGKEMLRLLTSAPAAEVLPAAPALPAPQAEPKVEQLMPPVFDKMFDEIFKR